MDPRQVPPAPPPLPVTATHNPYDFITQPGEPKRSALSGGSKKKRILIVAVVAIILMLIAAIVIGLLTSGNSGPKTDYLSAAQQQAELIRVSDLGVKQAKGADAKNLAVTTKYSLLSEQPALLKLARKAGAPTDAKSLALSKSGDTDKLLTNAAQTNQFDAVFIKTMQSGLQSYQATLKKIYDETTTKTTKDILNAEYANAGVLIGDQKQ